MHIPSRREIIQTQKIKGGKIAAVLPIHYPRELLRAFNMHPIEILGPPQIKIKAGDFHFQSYTCSIVRTATSFLLDKGLDDVDLIFFPHTCDSLQGMASVWKDFIKPKQKIITLYLPRGKRKSDEDFLATELKKIYQKLADFTDLYPTDSELHEQIQIEEKIDDQLNSLYKNRDYYILSDREFYTVIRSREYLPTDDFIKLIDSLIKGKNNAHSIRLLLSGIVPEPMDLFNQINKMGAQIVADDLACCRRRLYAKINDNDPFRRMAKRLLSAPPCPTRGDLLGDRIGYLKQKIHEVNAKGLIIYDPKFCEPELFDVPMIRRKFQAIGVPVLHVEFEMSDSLSRQSLNRIEAFIEMLR